MTRLLFAINFLTNGGPTRVVQNLLKNIDLKKFKVFIVTIIDENDNKIVDDLKESGIEIIELRYNKSLFKIIQNKLDIVRIINNLNPEIIHTHGIVTTFICSDKRIKGKKITTIHNNMFEDYRYTYGLIKGFIYSWLHILKLRNFDMTICCSKSSYDILKNKVSKLGYIRNGIDVNVCSNKSEIRELIRKEFCINNDDIIYIYGGVLNKRKRVVELIELFRVNHSENEYLLIVGDGPTLVEARNKSDKHIIFTGFKENIIDYFHSADIYISNSSSEGFSISVIEALSCGLVCFLSSIPSHEECFEIDNKYYIGEVFNHYNFNYKKNILVNNLSEVSKMNLIDFQNKYLSSESMAREYIKLYDKLKKYK